MRSFWRECVFIVPAVLLAGLTVAGIWMNPFEVPDSSAQSDSTMVRVLEDESERQSQDESSSHQGDVEKVKKTSYKKTGQWKDGTFTGTGTGYGGTIQVKVTIKNGKMTKIEDVSHANETPEYYQKAVAIIPRMIKAQTPNVDTISGATYSSSGIREAVGHALNQAGAKISPLSAAKKSKSSSGGSARKKLAAGKPADGIYTGSAVCEKFDYTVTISVRFKNGRTKAISNLKVTDNEDTANVPYYEKAWKPMVKKLLKAQSASVDAVSGATYSSNAIVNAYKDAYNKAVSKNSKTNSKTNKKKSSGKSTGASSASPAPTLPPDDTEAVPAGTIQDGTYHVSAVCDPDEDKDFASYTLYADITFADGKCTAITNFSSTDETNRSYYTKAADGTAKSTGVVKQILDKQSAAGISAVSGATCSSKSIRKLYLEALTLAAGVEQKEDDSEVDAPSDSQDSTDSGNEEAEQPGDSFDADEGQTGDAAIKDGTYSVSATVADIYGDFWDYLISADVVFENGKLIAIENRMADTDSTNKYYCDKAADGTTKKPGVIAQLIAAQSSEVDVVSGATCSSLAWIEIYEKALALAQAED